MASVQTSRKIGRVSTVDALSEALRERILSGDLAPGARLGEMELSTEYGVSRHSLRTAFRAMAGSGLLRHENNHGVYVAELTAADVNDIYALRRLLELEAVQRLHDPAQGAHGVAAAVQELESLSPDSDWKSVRDLDLNFHRALVDSLCRPRASRVFVSLMDEMRLAFRQIRVQFEHPSDVARQHREIFDAAVSGCGQEAAALLDRHLSDAEAEIATALAQS